MNWVAGSGGFEKHFEVQTFQNKDLEISSKIVESRKFESRASK